MIIMLMGVSGSGKSTIGERLAAELGWPFLEGDRFHPPENIAKMARGEPLTDADREPWLASLRAAIDRLVAENTDAVLACSALRRSYRETLTRGHEHAVAIVHLRADHDTVLHRMQGRQHYMKPAMLKSQLRTLEPPGEDEATIVDVTQPPDTTVAEIRRRLRV